MNEFSELLDCSDDPAARRAGKQLEGVTDVILHPIDWAKKTMAERAVSKAKEEAEARLREEAEWKRSGAPLSKKADTALTILKWGVILGPITYLVATFAPLIRGTGAALSGAGTALKGAGEAAREGARAVSTARERLTRENPWDLIPFEPLDLKEYNRRRYTKLESLHFMAVWLVAKTKDTPQAVAADATLAAIGFIRSSPMTRLQRDLLTNQARLTAYVNGEIAKAANAERAGSISRAERIRTRATFISYLLQWLTNKNAPMPELPKEEK